MFLFDPMIEYLLEFFTKSYRRAPKITVILTIMIITAMASVIYITETNRRAEEEAKRLQNQDYAKQIDSLSQIRGNLEGESIPFFVEIPQRPLCHGLTQRNLWTCFP